MSSKNNSAASGTGREMSKKRALWYTLLFFVLAGGCVSLLWASGHYLNRFLLMDNPRLQLRKIVIRSTGFWAGREKLLARRLKLRCADDALPAGGEGVFETDPAELRKTLLKIPGIKSCEVRRILPGTLDFRIIERLPRASLGSARSPWLVDDEGVLFPRSESVCQIRTITLPVILGYRPDQRLTVGGRCPGLESALQLIDLTVRSFPDLEIRCISLARTKSDKTLELFVRYRKMRECRVILPARDRNYAFRLSELQSAVLYAEQRGDQRHTFDLTFEGSAIIR